jgi:hypothetical protein
MNDLSRAQELKITLDVLRQSVVTAVEQSDFKGAKALAQIIRDTEKAFRGAVIEEHTAEVERRALEAKIEAERAFRAGK